MKRFARIAATLGVAVAALGLAIAASAGTSKTTGGTSQTTGQAVTDYLKYVGGTKGKADPKKSKIYIGWVNQQGGQVVIGGLATAGAQLAVKYVNDQLGGIDGHPVALVTCFIKSARGGGHDLAGRSSSTTSGSPSSRQVPSPRVRSRCARRSARRSRSSRASPSRRSTEPGRRASCSSATARTSSCRSATTRRTSSTRRPPQSSIRTRPASRSRGR